MAENDPFLTVTDAGPIIHLDELLCLDLLRDFKTLLIPRAVWDEVIRSRPRLTPEDVLGAGGCLADIPDVRSPPETVAHEVLRDRDLTHDDHAPPVGP